MKDVWQLSPSDPLQGDENLKLVKSCIAWESSFSSAGPDSGINVLSKPGRIGDIADEIDGPALTR